MNEISLPTSPRFCQATNKKGNRCGKHALLNGKYCASHSPEYAESNAASISKAHTALVKKAKLNKSFEINTMDDMLKAHSYVLGKLYKKAHESSLNTKEIQSFATIGRSWIKAKSEQEQLDRLTVLEAKTKSLAG